MQDVPADKCSSEVSTQNKADNTSTKAETAPPTAGEVKAGKKKRANPVYITPVNKKPKKTYCSDSDEDGIAGDDSAWGPSGKKKSKGKKKGAGKGKGKKGKKGDDSD